MSSARRVGLECGTPSLVFAVASSMATLTLTRYPQIVLPRLVRNTRISDRQVGNGSIAI